MILRRPVTLFFLVGAVLATACGRSVAPDQSVFVLSSSWRGQLLSLGQQLSFGELTLQLEGEEDGRIEEYRGEGTLFGNRFNNRLQQVDAEYDTTNATIEMTIIDFPGTGAVFQGTFDGTSLFLSDSVFCICEVALTR